MNVIKILLSGNVPSISPSQKNFLKAIHFNDELLNDVERISKGDSSQQEQLFVGLDDSQDVTSGPLNQSSEFNSEIQTLKSQKIQSENLLNRRIEELQMEIFKNNNEISSLQNYLYTSQEENSQLRTGYEQLQNYLYTSQEENSQLRTDYEQLQNYLYTLQNENSQLRTGYEQLQNENSQLRSKNIFKNNTQTQSKLNSLQNENQKLQNKIKSLQNENQKLQNKINFLQNENQCLQNLINNAVQENENQMKTTIRMQNIQTMKDRPTSDLEKFHIDCWNKLDALRNDFKMLTISQEDMSKQLADDSQVNRVRFMFLQQLQVQRKFLYLCQKVQNDLLDRETISMMTK